MAKTSLSFNRQTYPVRDKEPIPKRLVSLDESSGLYYRGRLYVSLEVTAKRLSVTFDSATRIMHEGRHQPHFTFDVITTEPDKQIYVSEESIETVLATRFALREKGLFVEFVQPQSSNNGSSVCLDGTQYLGTNVVADRLSITSNSAGRILYEGRHLDPYCTYDPSFSLRYISDRFLGPSYFPEPSVEHLVANRFVLNRPDSTFEVCPPDSVEGGSKSSSEGQENAESLIVDGVLFDGIPIIADRLDISPTFAKRPLLSDRSKILGWNVMHDCFFNHWYLRRSDLDRTCRERFSLHADSYTQAIVSADSVEKHRLNGHIKSCLINGRPYVSLSEAAPDYGVVHGESLRRRIYRETLYPYVYDSFLQQFLVPVAPSPHG